MTRRGLWICLLVLLTLPARSRAQEEEPISAEAAALIAQQGLSDAETPGKSALKVYGFMDFGMDKYFLKHDGGGLLRPTLASTFVFGNANLYLDAAPMAHMRSLIEVRLTLAPHGEEIQLGPPLGTSYERIDTTTFDFSSPSSQSQLRLGGIFIERTFCEYTFSELLNVRWGLYLNPWGIWNLDHGSPTLISLMLPTFIAAQMVPTRLLGVHAYGAWISGSSELGYSVHVSNGRTPLDFDLTEDKAVGARLYYAREGQFGRLVLGANGYLGTYVDEEKVLTADSTSSLVSENLFNVKRTVDYAEQVLGFDAALDWHALRVRSEAVFRWIEYEGDKSERVITADGSVQYLPNRLEWSTYVVAAYRTPWLVEPYLQAELSKKSYTMPRWAGTSRATNSDFTSLFLSVGFNIQLTSYLLWKTQLVWAHAYQRDFSLNAAGGETIFVRLVDSF